MQRIQHAFRLYLEGEQRLSPWTARRYVTGAGHLLDYCESHGLELESGQVPSTLLTEFGAQADETRLVRGAILFCRFLIGRGVPLSELDGLNDELDREEAERFLAAARELPEPYATLVCLLPLSGVPARELRQLPLAAVVEDGDSLALSHQGGQVRLGVMGSALLGSYLDGWRVGGERPESALLFPNETGAPIGASTISRRCKQCREQAGLPEFRMSTLSALYDAYFNDHDAWSEGEGEGEGGSDAAQLGGLDGLPEDADVSEPSHPPRSHSPPTAALPSDDVLPNGDDAHPDEDPTEEAMHHDDDDDDRPPTRDRSTNRRPAKAREVDRLLPKQGTLYIRRRGEDGSIVYCGHYSVMDVAPDGAIEPFLFEHLAPRHGGGEYLIYLKATADTPRVIVRIADPGRSTPAHPSAPVPPRGLAQQSPMQTIREAIQLLEELKKSEGSPMSLDAAHRFARMEVKLEQLMQQQHAPPFGSVLDGVPHPSWSPPLPGPERSDTSADRVLLDMLMEDRRHAREVAADERRERREREEREREERKAERLALERERRALEEARLGPTKLDRFKEAETTLHSAVSLMSTANTFANANDNAANGPMPLIVKTATETAVNTALNRLKDWSGPGASGLNGAGSQQPSSPKKKAKGKRPSKYSKRSRQAAAPEPRENGLPTEVPATFPRVATLLDQAVEAQASGEEVIEALVHALAALGMSPAWEPFVKDTCVHLVQDDKEATLPRLRAILHALVRAEHLQRQSANGVMAIADEHWDEARAQITTALQQYMAQQMRPTG